MITLTFAGDESGDTGFAFHAGASRYFVVAMIATRDPEALRQVLTEVRRAAGLAASYEFSFHALSSARLRERVLNALAAADFEAWALVADKPELPDSFKVMHGIDFYLYCLTELMRILPAEEREGATLILDEFGSTHQLRSELQRVLKARQIPRRFRRVLIKRSRSEPLIQVADLVAGAVLRRDAKGDVGAFEILQGKMRRVVELRAP